MSGKKERTIPRKRTTEQESESGEKMGRSDCQKQKNKEMKLRNLKSRAGVRDTCEIIVLFVLNYKSPASCRGDILNKKVNSVRIKIIGKKITKNKKTEK